MGTNYYHRFNVCPHCERWDSAHICKSGSLFHALTREDSEGHIRVVVSTWAQWQDRLREDGFVLDEYDKRIDVDEFIERFAASGSGDSHPQLRYVAEGELIACPSPGDVIRWDRHSSWLDPDGYLFHAFEFC